MTEALVRYSKIVQSVIFLFLENGIHANVQTSRPADPDDLIGRARWLVETGSKEENSEKH